MLKNSPFVLEFASLQFQTFQTFNDCAGDCLAPLHKNILNSALSTCEEGSRPNLVCTARCAESYYPVPATLDCQGHRGKDGMNSARSTSWWGTLKANCLSLSLPCLTMPWWLCSGCPGEPKPNFMKLQQIISSIIVDWKLPFILHPVYWLDTGSQLVPEKFRCFGGPSTEVEWCEITQISSIVFSSLTFLGLLVACYSFQRNKAGLAGQLASCISFWSFLPLFELVIVAGAIVPKLPPSR